MRKRKQGIFCRVLHTFLFQQHFGIVDLACIGLCTFRHHLSCQFVKELRVDRETLKDDELREVSSRRH